MEGAPPTQQRPRLVLKPRDEAAAKKAEADRVAKVTHNPFGDAKPREAILAARTGKTEQQILQEAVRSERLRLRLNAQQLEEKEQLEELVKEAKDALSAEVDEAGKAAAAALVQEREAAVDAMMDRFAKASLEAAQRGEVMRPSERRMEHGAAAGGSYGGPPARGPYGGRDGAGGTGQGYHDAAPRPRDIQGPPGGGRGFGNGAGYQERSGGGGGGGFGSSYDEARYDQPAHGAGDDVRGRYHRDGTGFKEVQAPGTYGSSGPAGARGKGGMAGSGATADLDYLPGMMGGPPGGHGPGWGRASLASAGSGGPVDYVSPYGSQDRY